MRAHLPEILLVLSLPAGAIGYALATRVLVFLLPGAAQGILVLFVPLLVAGLCMLPFLVPFFDRKAKQDLEAHRRQQETAPKPRDEGPTE